MASVEAPHIKTRTTTLATIKETLTNGNERVSTSSLSGSIVRNPCNEKRRLRDLAIYLWRSVASRLAVKQFRLTIFNTSLINPVSSNAAAKIKMTATAQP